MGFKDKIDNAPLEEDSSVAVCAATFQKFGLILEQDLPYQSSWFEKGYPCEGKREKTEIDPTCYSHVGPKKEVLDHLLDGKNFVFEAVGSESIDVVRSLARVKNPVTISILGHKSMWDETYQTGNLYLNERLKTKCQTNAKACGSHTVLAVGYDLDKRVFLIKNSWGEKWGNQGYGTVSFDYIDQMSDRKFLTGHNEGQISLPSIEK